MLESGILGRKIAFSETTLSGLDPVQTESGQTTGCESGFYHTLSHLSLRPLWAKGRKGSWGQLSDWSGLGARTQHVHRD